MTNKPNTFKLSAEYLSSESAMNHFAGELTRQIEKLLEQKDIHLGVPIQQRVKSLDSIFQKIQRDSLSVGSIKEITDLIGLRLILLFDRDVKTTCDILNSTFRVLERENTQDRLDESQFGYASFHFLIELPAEWLAVPTLAQFSDLKAEIQVRTVAQHIWAAASHVLQYKQESNVPPPIRRAISRVSAFLEQVDLEFERVLDQRDSYRKKIDTDVLPETLNVDTLARILDQNLPAANKNEPESYSDLLADLQYFRLKTDKFTEILRKHKSAVLKKDAEVASKFGRHERSDFEERIKRGVWFTHVGLARSAIQLEFPEKWKKYSEEKLSPKVIDVAKKTSPKSKGSI